MTKKNEVKEHRVLVLGSGGREHALAHRMSKDPSTHIFLAPGNDGAFYFSPHILRAAINIDQFSTLTEFIVKESINLVVIGPELYLASGLVDKIQGAFPELAVFGPTREASQLESSKIYAKNFMRSFAIPTADFWISQGNLHDAMNLLDELPWDLDREGVVVKASGLFAGKGVVVCNNRAEAEKALFDMIVNPEFSVKSHDILLERKLVGRELSAFALLDGNHFIELGYAVDYKRLKDGQKGPNTGGMGAVSPPQFLNSQLKREIQTEVFEKVLKGAAHSGHPFKGFLFAGLMLTDEGKLQVIEFNVRMGDPETQALMPLVSGHFTETLYKAAKANIKLSEVNLSLKEKKSVHVVVTSKGYPALQGEKMHLGSSLHWTKGSLSELKVKLTEEKDREVYSAALKQAPGEAVDLLNRGGRVFGVTAEGDTYREAREKAYNLVSELQFDECFSRKDIGAEFMDWEGSRKNGLPRPIKLAIFASGRGSNAENLSRVAYELNHLEVKLLVSDHEHAPVLEKEIWQEQGIKSYSVDLKKVGKAQFEEDVLKELQSQEVDMILLAGFMRLLSANFIEKFRHQSKLKLPEHKRAPIINIHPSLLPKYSGLNAYERSFAAGDEESGVTLHFVDEGIDTGPIIHQSIFPRKAADDFDTFMERGLEVEHEVYGNFLKRLNSLNFPFEL